VFALAIGALTSIGPSAASAAVGRPPLAEWTAAKPKPVEARSTRAKRAAVRAHKARVARIKWRYARMARVRARIPVTVRKVRAGRELARMQRQGSLHCLTTAIYHEARYESAAGQRAVAEVVLARTRVPGRPKTICGVVYQGNWRATGCQFSFTCDGLSDGARDPAQWSRARRSAQAALAKNGKAKRYARGATFYHASYVRPRWAKQMVRVAKIGTHIFYRPRRR
jgi:spore germination cell wall hydrolase CwlJ-like protein